MVKGNPCTGSFRDRRPQREWLLTAVLRVGEDEMSVCVTAVQSILLTGCRPGEIRRLRWCEVKCDRLTSIDAKTGRRYRIPKYLLKHQQ